MFAGLLLGGMRHSPEDKPPDPRGAGGRNLLPKESIVLVGLSDFPNTIPIKGPSLEGRQRELSWGTGSGEGNTEKDEEISCLRRRSWGQRWRENSRISQQPSDTLASSTPERQR